MLFVAVVIGQSYLLRSWFYDTQLKTARLKLSHTFAQLMKQASTQLQMSYVSHWIQHQYHKIQMVL